MRSTQTCLLQFFALHPPCISSDYNHPIHVSAESVFLTSKWHYLAILNYEADARLLLPLVPRGTELDRWENKVFVSLIGFQFLNTKLFGMLPIPFHSDFDEINLRFYVRRQVQDEVRRGVVFIREIVPRRATAFVAKVFYNENYIALPMAHQVHSTEGAVCATYRWRFDGSWNDISVRTVGVAQVPAADSVEQFITEHYWGYSSQRGGGCVEYRVAHPSWKVWQVQQSSFTGEQRNLFGNELSAVLQSAPHSAFLAEGSAVTVMFGRKL